MAVPKRFKSKKKIFYKTNSYTKYCKSKEILKLFRKFFNKSIIMLFWVKFIFFSLFLVLVTLNLFTKNLLSLILSSEFVVVLLFLLYTLNGLIYNLNWIFGFSFLIIVLGGLEIALSFLLLNL